MAMQAVVVSFAAEQGPKTFTFTKPAANYGKGTGLTITDGGGGATPYLIADVDNGDGTMTGSVSLSAPASGSVLITIYDTP